MDAKHNRAFLVSLEILNVFSGVLREDERRDALWAIYECVRNGQLEQEPGPRYPMAWLNPARN